MEIDDAIQKYKSLIQKLNSELNLQFIIRESDLENAVKRSESSMAETAIKMAVLYANNSIIVSNPKTYYVAAGNPPPIAQSQWERSYVAEELIRLYSEFNQNSLFSRTVHFVPEKLIRSVENWYNEDEWFTDELTLFEFPNQYNNKFGVDMSFGDPSINSHLLHSLDCNSDEMAVTNIWLPNISNVPLGILLKMREDESDSFTRFQYALKQFVTESEAVDSETKVKEVLQKVDYEVRLLETKMQHIQKKRTLKSMDAFVGFAVMGLCLALPSEVAQVVSSALGMYQGKEFISHLFRVREEIHDLRSSDFYIPWLVTKRQK